MTKEQFAEARCRLAKHPDMSKKDLFNHLHKILAWDEQDARWAAACAISQQKEKATK